MSVAVCAGRILGRASRVRVHPANASELERVGGQRHEKMEMDTNTIDQYRALDPVRSSTIRNPDGGSFASHFVR